MRTTGQVRAGGFFGGCANDEPLAVGAKDAPALGTLEAFWDGRLDDVRVYRRALSATAVAGLAP